MNIHMQNYGRVELVYSGHEININRDLIYRTIGDNTAMHIRVRTLNESFLVLKLYYN